MNEQKEQAGYRPSHIYKGRKLIRGWIRNFIVSGRSKAAIARELGTTRHYLLTKCEEVPYEDVKSIVDAYPDQLLVTITARDDDAFYFDSKVFGSPDIPSIESVNHLIDHWRQDPCWDLTDAADYEHYTPFLSWYQSVKEAERKQRAEVRLQRERESLQKWTQDNGLIDVESIALYIAMLHQRVAELEARDG